MEHGAIAAGAAGGGVGEAGAIDARVGDEARDALVRELLARVADRWSLLVVFALEGEAAVRFSALQQRLPGVSQKMLTQTLRQLERDGLVARRVHPAVPPRVDYRLTPLGEGLGEALCGVWEWAAAHGDAVRAARAAFDARGGADGAADGAADGDALGAARGR